MLNITQPELEEPLVLYILCLYYAHYTYPTNFGECYRTEGLWLNASVPFKQRH